MALATKHPRRTLSKLRFAVTVITISKELPWGKVFILSPLRSITTIDVISQEIDKEGDVFQDSCEIRKLCEKFDDSQKFLYLLDKKQECPITTHKPCENDDETNCVKHELQTLFPLDDLGFKDAEVLRSFLIIPTHIDKESKQRTLMKNIPQLWDQLIGE